MGTNESNITYVQENLDPERIDEITTKTKAMHFMEHTFPIGSLVMNGPYFEDKVCYLGSNCTIFLQGVGLRENDYLYLSTE